MTPKKSPLFLFSPLAINGYNTRRVVEEEKEVLNTKDKTKGEML
jgi:hypothetical protein